MSPPRLSCPWGWGVPARLGGGSPGLGGAQAAGTLWLPSAGPGTAGVWTLAASCPCQGCKAPDEAGPGQRQGSQYPQYVSWVMPASPGCSPLVWNGMWGWGPHVDGKARERPHVPHHLPQVPPRSARGCLSAAGEGLLSPSLSPFPSPPSSRPHPTLTRTWTWWPPAGTTTTMRPRPSMLSSPTTSFKLKSRSAFSPLAAPLSQACRGQQVPEASPALSPCCPPISPHHGGDPPGSATLPAVSPVFL